MDTQSKIQLASVYTAGLFAGCALYITAVDQPNRVKLPENARLIQWRLMYKGVAPIQASLALLSGVLAFVASKKLQGSSSKLFKVGGALIFSVIPFTFAAIMPTNKILLDEKKQLPEEEINTLLTRWGYLHAVRTVLSLAAFAVLLSAI